jgi:hypothetical protein
LHLRRLSVSSPGMHQNARKIANGTYKLANVSEILVRALH